MDEFIIFDNENKEFIYPCEYDNSLYWFEENHICSFDDFGDDKDFNIFWYTGKKDINNKKIYADCSIVRFKNETDDLDLCYYNGYFEFNKYTLCYDLFIFLKNGSVDQLDYQPEGFIGLKIIDTIQENKLGLIKE